jgi:glycerate dehydrogenase
MKIVFLDSKSVGEDINLSNYSTLGEFIKYDFTPFDKISERTLDADVIITNKALINKDSIGNSHNLKLVCVTATGTNNLDKEYLKHKLRQLQ